MPVPPILSLGPAHGLQWPSWKNQLINSIHVRWVQMKRSNTRPGCRVLMIFYVFLPFIYRFFPDVFRTPSVPGCASLRRIRTSWGKSLNLENAEIANNTAGDNPLSDFFSQKKQHSQRTSTIFRHLPPAICDHLSKLIKPVSVQAVPIPSCAYHSDVFLSLKKIPMKPSSYARSHRTPDRCLSLSLDLLEDPKKIFNPKMW